MASIILHSFLWPNNDSLYGYTTFCLSVIDILLVSLLLHILCWHLSWHKHLSESLFSVPWGYILRTELLPCNSLFNILGSAKNYFTFPLANTRVSISSHITNTRWSCGKLKCWTTDVWVYFWTLNSFIDLIYFTVLIWVYTHALLTWVDYLLSCSKL